MSLSLYNKKRNFKNTPEPFKGAKRSSSKKIFVVQRHDASHLHYDFRLEVDGVLKSWAVPKGPSMNPRDKRLAVMVEDHPLGYAKFHGTIPKGNYGAGTVEIWDNGVYEPVENNGSADKEVNKEIKEGSLKFILHGKKLKGSFALVRLKDADEKNWLLIKHKDEFSNDEETNDKGKIPSSSKKKVEAGSIKRSTGFIKPMLAYSAEKAFNDPEWLFEIKWDGYRAIAEINKKEILLYSRNNISFVSKYPLIAEALKKIKHDAILDGEIVALDENNKPNFQLLQNYEKDSSLPLLYYVFDCLNIDGKDIKDIPLIQRKKLLKKIILPKSIIKYCDHVMEKGKDFFSAIIQNDLEGMMAKKKDSLYSPGVRTNQWLKIKHHHIQEAVIAGFTEPRNSRKYFGALILGIYEKKRLHYVGHTGTGFTEQTLKDLHQKMQPHIRLTSPFSEKIKTNAPVTWVDPVLVCNIKFTEKTKSYQLRHPVFMGLRIDKAAKETTMEETNAVNTKKQKTQKKESEVITVGDHQLTLTHGDKLYWPKDKITKADMINYYSSMSKYILPYLKGRPQSLKRNPNGIIDEGFYHKDAGDIAPKWINTVKLYSDSADKKINYIICDDEATLFFLNNLGCIEINPWNSTVKHLDEPDYLVMDIDPSEKNAFDDVVDVALVLKEIFDKAGAKSYCKTSGATGLHVYVPFHAAYDYEQVRSFANAIALMTQEKLPATTTMERSLNKRNGKIYLDYLQNKKGQTLASVYSLRPRPGAPVSTPLLWKEVRHGLDPHAFNIHTIKRRVEKKGDLFAGILTEKTNLRQCLKKLNF